jgi:hypothetical protein
MFALDFNICQSCCNALLFTETTGVFHPNMSECCKTGYGYSDNPTTDEVISSLFTVTYPGGQVYTGVNLGYVPPVMASASFTLSGASGSVVLVADGVSLGSAIFVTDLTQTVNDLVNSINQDSCQHGYMATSVGNTITIYDMNGGALANGKTVLVDVFVLGTTATTLTLAGGAGDGWCFEFGSGDIDETDVNQCFSDGVYEFTWTIEVEDSETQEVQQFTKTKKFLFDCMSKKCLKELILLSTGCKPCNDNDIHGKIQKLRTDIEAANLLFKKCEYDCANNLIQKTQKFCQNACLDC